MAYPGGPRGTCPRGKKKRERRGREREGEREEEREGREGRGERTKKRQKSKMKINLKDTLKKTEFSQRMLP